MTRAANATPVHAWRFYLVSVVLCSLLALLVGRILSLQVLDTERGRQFLQNQGERRAVRTAEIPAYRGVITDRRGEPLAVSTPVVSIWADPQVLATSERLPELAGVLGMSLDDLAGKLEAYRGKRFMYLQRHRVPADARAILEKRIRGVYGEREYRRFYPAGEVAAQLVGFTNLDGEGIAGLELAYDDWLRGSPGRKKYIKDLHGEVVRDIGVVEPARPGRDLKLSIDLRLQYLQHRELRKAVTASGAASGSVVTLDARSGEILAMVNYPVYNPNSRKGLKPAHMRNRAMTDVYEPGSTMKTLTLVAALESGRYTPETMIDTSPGRIRVGRKTYPDPRNYGEISLTRVIQKSSQVGVTKIALDLGHEPIWEVFNRFGIGQPPGTGFPGESAGMLPNRPRWHATEKVSLAFGYGITASPLQLASAYTVFANGGLRRPASLLALDDELPPGEPVISPEVARQVLQVLHAVTGEHGTARKARVPGYPVGGKTGTVHKVGPQGYIDDQYVALFAGVAPSDDPRIVTVVVINEPKGENYGGGAAAAPVFSRVAAGALRLLNVPPSERPEVAAAADPRQGFCLMLATGGCSGRPVPLNQLLGREVGGDGEVLVTGIQLDSRVVEAGDVFLAMPGELHDGRQFIEQAVANGASAVIAEAPVAGFVDEIPVPLVEVPELRQDAGCIAARFFGHPSRDLHMVGITGTNGKTTTSRLFAQLGRAVGKSCGVIGTLGASLGDEVGEAGNTTPDPVSLQRQLADWREQGVYAVAMEVSSHALTQGRVNGVDFETAVFTNLSHDHLDYHGSMDAYGRAKLALFAREELSHAVINVDDAFAARVVAAVRPGARVVTYSIGDADADVQVREASFHPGGVRAKLHTPWGTGVFESPLPGDFNLANLAAAVTAMVLAGEDLAAVLAAVAQLRPVPGRMELVPNEAGLQIIVDYAHTPDALHQVLSSLRRHVDGALVTVFGCGGDRDRDKRQLMGRVACDLSDRVIVTSDNPRSESPADILRDIEAGCSGDYLLLEDRAEAIRRAVGEGRPGDCIVIAGKGHEDYQIVEGERLYFSDTEQARAAVAARVGS